MPQPVLTQEIVVTAERVEHRIEKTTAAITVLTRNDIEKVPAKNLAELVGLAPGMLVLFPHSSGTVPMVLSRGFFGGGEVEYVRLLVDGIPVYDVESGIADWRAIDAAAIERIELVRGTGSALWGDTALGGVVQVFTKKSADPTTTVALGAGSSGAWAGDGSYQDRNLSASLRISAADGYREHSGAEEGFGDLSLLYGDWSLHLAASDRDREEPGPLSMTEAQRNRRTSDAMFGMDREQSRRGRISLDYQRSATYATVFASRREMDLTRTLLIAAGIGDRLFREVSTTSVGGSAESDLLLPASASLHLAVDAAFDEMDTDYRPHDAGPLIVRGSGRRQRAGGLVSGAIDVSDRFRLTGGVRFDRLADHFESVSMSSQTHSAWSPRVGFSVSGSPGSAFVQLSRAFKAPTLDQLFDPRPFPDFQGGSFTVSNATLSPQTADNVEVGFSRRRAEYRLEMVAYRIAVDDEIDFDPATFRYANIGSTVHSGVELDVAGNLFQRLESRLVYTLTNVESQEGSYQGKQLKNIPRHLLRLTASTTLSNRLSAGIVASWIGQRFLDDANLMPLDDAATVDLRILYEVGPLRVSLDLLNLTDADYEELGFVLPDLEGMFVPYVIPAAGREIRAGLQWRFDTGERKIP